MNKDYINVVFSSDDNYAPYLGAAIYSLLCYNSDFEHVAVFVIDNKIRKENKKKISAIVNNASNSEIIWIPFEKYREKLKLDLIWNISISSYARLFISEMVPKSVERIVYMDCDMIVCQSLRELWNTDLNGKIIGAVQDTVGTNAKEQVDLSASEKYFNAGMLLVDLDAWRERNIGAECLTFLERHNGQVYHHDQGVLNGVLCNEKYILPMRYNTITIHYFFNMRQIRKFYSETADFYSVEEIEKAKKNPVIIHFTPSFTSRPWVKGCRHPLKKRFWDAVDHTPWKGMVPLKNQEKWYVRLINWRYRVLPY